MVDEGACLGICYAGNQLFYSVNEPQQNGSLKYIGCIDFNFDVCNAISRRDGESFLGIKASLDKLKHRFDATTVRILSPGIEECWTILPRSVYEEPAERDAHIQLLMHGEDASKLESTWYNLHNVDYRQLLIRHSDTMQGFTHLLGDFTHSEYVAEFEVGSEWQEHTRVNGSFLTIQCHKNYLSVSSHLLGKLRGSSIIKFDNRTDLPYMWTLYSNELSWMNGIHEQIYMYGQFSQEVHEVLLPYLDDSGDVDIMNSLEKMQVDASESTYGFRLESAFPAVLLSLNRDSKQELSHANHNG